MRTNALFNAIAEVVPAHPLSGADAGLYQRSGGVEMTSSAPPPVLDCARVIAYANIDASISYRPTNRLYVGGNLLGRIPALAICQNLGPERETLVFHCDERWNVLGSTGAETVDAAIQAAERDYPGLEKHWVCLDTSVETALAYFDATFGGRCSFCGKRPFEVVGLVQSESAAICRDCIEKFFHCDSASDTEAPTN
jgi:hypothetical protein